MTEESPIDLVRKGYDALSHRYRADDADEGRYAPWLAGLRERLPTAARVLDLGCGCGVPVARTLSDAGYQVTGVDISEVQIGRARMLVPRAAFVCADAMTVTFAPASFDAIVCLYALFHLPLDAQPLLLARAAGWLRPSGWMLVTVGQRAWTGTDNDWLGGNAAMWWAQADAATYDEWLRQAGLDIVERDFVPEGDSGHALFWARRPGVSGCQPAGTAR